MKNTFKVAVTGGIGSGKSTVIRILTELNYKTVSCDDIVKKLYESNAFRRKIKKEFPFVAKGLIKISIDKKALSDRVFSDKKELDKLNKITHPLIMKEIDDFFNNCGDDIAFAEVPLLFEGGYEKFFDKVIVVTRDLDKRIDSVMKRSSLSRIEVLKRIKSQFDYSSFDYNSLGTTSFVVVDNNAEEEILKEIIKAVAKDFSKKNK